MKYTGAHENDSAAPGKGPADMTTAAGIDNMAWLGLGRIVALHHRASTLDQSHSHIRCIFF
jgi:hypothetical protein